MEKNEYLLEVKGLKKYFKVGKGTLKAVDDVSFYIRPGETLGVVGESGCGKTTCGRTVLGLYDRKVRSASSSRSTRRLFSRIRMRPWIRR